MGGLGLLSDPSEDGYERIRSLVLRLEDVGRDETLALLAEQRVELETEGYHRSSFYRLGSLRLIEPPLRAYDRAGDATPEATRPENNAGSAHSTPGSEAGENGTLPAVVRPA
jgi:hypothetical protein